MYYIKVNKTKVGKGRRNVAQILLIPLLQGFKHFSAYLRGREELLITVKTPPDADCQPVAHCENAVVSPR
jgi:hypothetical protein